MYSKYWHPNINSAKFTLGLHQRHDKFNVREPTEHLPIYKDCNIEEGSIWMAESKNCCDLISLSNGANMSSFKRPWKSVLNRIGISENTVLVLTAILISFSGRSLLSELWLGLSSSLLLVATRVDVLESFSETVLDGHDLSRSFVQEVVNLRLHLRVGLPVIFFEFDLRDSILNLLD